ncbi:LysM peptidoglycan-binding domain-containing protein [Patescibacteria group bacterium]
MLRTCICAIALIVIVVSSGVLAQPGLFFERTDGTYGYIVQENDDLGQWGIALGASDIWLELVDANPQLADPDLIVAGDTLNIPPTLVRTFEMLTAVDAAGGPMPTKGAGPVPVVEAQTETNGFPLGIILAVLITALLAAIPLIWLRRRRIIADPYYGPPVHEGGLPTVNAAVDHFTQRYRNWRESLHVSRDRVLPESVTIASIRPVEVMGPMRIRYGGKTGTAERNLRRWTPAWECRMSDNTVYYTLQECGNDVIVGNGMTAMPETQVRSRQSESFEPQRQVWPEVRDVEPTPELEVPDEVAVYQEVRVKSANRWVLLLGEGAEKIIDIGVLGGILSLGIDGGNIIAKTDQGSKVIGRIAEPTTPEVKPADDSAQTEPASEEVPTS